MTDHEAEDRVYKWEIEPHPYDSSYDIFVTDDDDVARQAILHAADAIFDSMEDGEEKKLVIRMHDTSSVEQQRGDGQ